MLGINLRAFKYISSPAGAVSPWTIFIFVLHFAARINRDARASFLDDLVKIARVDVASITGNTGIRKIPAGPGMQHGVRKTVVLRAEVAADASRDVMACVVGVPTATVARYSLARATLLSTMAFRVSRPSCLPPSRPPLFRRSRSSFSRSMLPSVRLFE